MLLDTHIFLWLSSEPEKLSSQARDLCEDTANQLYLSLVTPWEVQIKQQLGKLECKQPLSTLIGTQQRENDLHLLPVQLEHIYGLASLPNHHRDPFDRLLIAQAITESMVLVTVDEKIPLYPVATVG